MRNAQPAALTEPLAVRPAVAADMLGVSRATIFRELQAGRLRSVKAGAARLIPTAALRVWLADREAESCA